MNRNLPSPSQVPLNMKKPGKDKKNMPMMTYSQKKEALKRILSSANLKNKGGIKPIASSLLQALKEKRPTLKPTNHPQKFSHRLKQYQKNPIFCKLAPVFVFKLRIEGNCLSASQLHCFWT